MGSLAVAGVALGVAGFVLPPLDIRWPSFGHEAQVEPAGTGFASPPMPRMPASFARMPGTVVSAPPAAQASAPRRVYPYSIIPGGVADKAELTRIIRSDRVVAVHYASFDVDRARPVTVTQPRAVYVSYRKGDQVYWTAKKLMLAQGETLLTDGEHEMRARCANRISDVPQFPVESHGPTETELDAYAIEDGVGADSLLAVGSDPGDLDDDAAVGYRYHTTSFPHGAGLLPTGAAADQGRRLANLASYPGRYQSPVAYGGVLGGASRGGGSDGSNGNGGAGGTGADAPGADSGGAAPAMPGDTVGITPGNDGANGGNGDAGSVGGNAGSGGTGTDGGSGGGAPGNAGGGTGPGSSGGNGGAGPGTGNDGGNPSHTPGENPGATPGSGQPATPTPPVPIPGGDTDTGPAIPPATPGGAPGTGPETPPTTPGQPGTPGGIGVGVDPAAPVDVPEPGTVWLGGAALAAMLWLRRRSPRRGR